MDKQAAMMAEVKTLTEEMAKSQQATMNDFVKRLKNAASMQERTEVTQEMKAYQLSSAQALQKAMAEIQQRYR